MNAVSWLEHPRSAWGALLLARAPRLAAGVLSLLLGVQAALILTRLAGASAPHAAPPPVPAFAGPAQLDVQAIADTHLFGMPPAPPPGDDAHAPPSTIPLVLTGIMAAPDPKAGLAIIGQTAATAKVYAVGDRVAGGPLLHAIYTDRVLIDRDGHIEALMLPHEMLGGAAPPVRPSAFERVRRALTDEPGLLSDVLHPQPVFIEGKQRGYRVYPGRNARAFASLGLRNGDLVTAINGQPLDDPARSEEVFRTLSSTDQASVTVMRDGQQQELTLNMSQVATEAEQLAAPAGNGGTDTTPQAASSPVFMPAPASGAQQSPFSRRDIR
ncbi:MAG TPA: type II secretion system protein GspC [Steroidobacteraceae bacterium]|nr:type II secretion system protein GspC [Steroidobacteraceae bacterium]